MCRQATLNANDVCYHKDDLGQADCDRLYVIAANSQTNRKSSPQTLLNLFN